MTAAVLIPAARRLVVADPLRRVEVLADGPRFLSTHWGGECAFAMRALDFDDVVHLSFPASRGLFEDGGHEFAVVLARRPASNRVRFSCGSAGLRFFRQPDGSHAAYHASRAGNFVDRHYRAGKAFHVLRPWAEDANGWRVWCELRMPECGTGLATIVVPQAFLDSASYPMLVDPTFGYTSIGASSGTLNIPSDGARCNMHTPLAAAAGSTLTLFSFYSATQGLSGDRASLDMAAYTLNGTPLPVSRLAAGVTITLPLQQNPAQWNDSATVSQSLATATYGVAFGNPVTVAGTPVGASVNFDTGSGSERSYDSADTGALPATWTNASTSASMYSCYATYSTSVTPPAPPVVAPSQAVQRAASW